MTTPTDSAVTESSTLVGTLITLAALGGAGLMAALSLWLMPIAGIVLVAVGWTGLKRGVPRGLAYVVLAIGLVFLGLSQLAFAPA